ncbi:MAG: hypothetical protein ABWY52_06245 [Candidatus Limnocylindrales bacterium]
MTPRPATKRLFPTLMASVLAAACAATAAVPVADPTVPSTSPAATPALDLPAPSLAAAPSPSMPTTGAGSVASGALDPEAWMPTAPSLDRFVRSVDPPEAPAVEPILDPPAVVEGPFEMDLYRRNDFVTEATKWYCVPAAMLTMINIMSRGAEHSRATQKGLYQLARRLSTKTLVGKGAEPIGWARGLEQLGFGAFEVGVHRTRRQAIQAAARAIRLTGRPAGLLVWRGAHSWVMSGFQATADPAVTDEFTVTHVNIEDVWYPYVSSIWGKSRPPDALVPVASLKEDYLKWRRPTRRYRDMDGRFVTILPVPEASSEVQP